MDDAFYSFQGNSVAEHVTKIVVVSVAQMSLTLTDERYKLGHAPDWSKRGEMKGVSFELKQIFVKYRDGTYVNEVT